MLPHNLKRIGTNAFGNCKYLTSITLDDDDSDGLYSIGDSAFINCSRLKETTSFMNNAGYIGTHAFMGCSFDSIALSKIKTIGYGAFRNIKTKQKTLTIPQSCDSIGSYAFENASVNEIILQTPKPRLGEYVFKNSELQSISIPDSWEKFRINFYITANR